MVCSLSWSSTKVILYGWSGRGVVSGVAPLTLRVGPSILANFPWCRACGVGSSSLPPLCGRGCGCG